MKIILTSFFFVLMSLSNLKAQSTSGKVQIEKGFPRYSYRYDELSLGIKEVALILRKNEKAYKLIKPAKVNSAIGNSFLFLGVSMIVVPIGQIILGESSKHYLAFAGIGAGMIAVSIPFIRKADRQAKNAVEVYNSGMSRNFNEKNKPEFHFGIMGNGIGSTIKF